jgi:glycine/D-amino acid oxidase-like deaminating enzyme
MTETADVVIVGGGIVGTSIAHFLSRRGLGQGVPGVTIIEVQYRAFGSGGAGGGSRDAAHLGRGAAAPRRQSLLRFAARSFPRRPPA